MVYKQTTLEILVIIALMKKKRHRPFLPRKNENHPLCIKKAQKSNESCCTYVLNGKPFRLHFFSLSLFSKFIVK